MFKLRCARTSRLSCVHDENLVSHPILPIPSCTQTITLPLQRLASDASLCPCTLHAMRHLCHTFTSSVRENPLSMLNPPCSSQNAFLLLYEIQPRRLGHCYSYNIFRCIQNPYVLRTPIKKLSRPHLHHRSWNLSSYHAVSYAQFSALGLVALLSSLTPRRVMILALDQVSVRNSPEISKVMTESNARLGHLSGRLCAL